MSDQIKEEEKNQYTGIDPPAIIAHSNNNIMTDPNTTEELMEPDCYCCVCLLFCIEGGGVNAGGCDLSGCDCNGCVC